MTTICKLNTHGLVNHKHAKTLDNTDLSESVKDVPIKMGVEIDVKPTLDQIDEALQRVKKIQVLLVDRVGKVVTYFLRTPLMYPSGDTIIVKLHIAKMSGNVYYSAHIPQCLSRDMKGAVVDLKRPKYEIPELIEQDVITYATSAHRACNTFVAPFFC